MMRDRVLGPEHYPDRYTDPQPEQTSGQTSQTAWHLAGGWCRQWFDHLWPNSLTGTGTGNRMSCPNHCKNIYSSYAMLSTGCIAYLNFLSE